MRSEVDLGNVRGVLGDLENVRLADPMKKLGYRAKVVNKQRQRYLKRWYAGWRMRFNNWSNNPGCKYLVIYIRAILTIYHQYIPACTHDCGPTSHSRILEVNPPRPTLHRKKRIFSSTYPEAPSCSAESWCCVC